MFCLFLLFLSKNQQNTAVIFSKPNPARKKVLWRNSDTRITLSLKRHSAKNKPSQTSISYLPLFAKRGGVLSLRAAEAILQNPQNTILELEERLMQQKLTKIIFAAEGFLQQSQQKWGFKLLLNC